jgi:hypothetical protein
MGHAADGSERTVRRALIAAGTLIMGFAVAGALADDDVRPFGVLLFLVGVLVWHDLVLMPFVLAVGAFIGRYVPAPARPAVRAAALCSLALVVIAAPLVLGLGRIADNPSVLPRPYGWGLVLVLTVLWTSALGTVAARRARRGRPARKGPGRTSRREVQP